MKLNNILNQMTSLVLVLIFLGFITGCQQQPSNEQIEAEMRALVERTLEIWNEGDINVADEICDPSFTRHEVNVNDVVVGVDAFKEYVSGVRTAYPDFTVTFDEILVMGDRIVARWTVTGTNTGVSELSPATGNRMEIEGVGISRVRDGKLVEELAYFNQAALLTQIGYTITPPSGEEEQ